MRIVFLTSSAHVHGLTSDDGFKIGTISCATVFLLIFTTILGGIAGLGVGVLRMVTSGPTWAVALATGVATAAFVGATNVSLMGPCRIASAASHGFEGRRSPTLGIASGGTPQWEL